MNSQAHNVQDLFCRLPERRRREAYVAMAMISKGITFADLGRDYGYTPWYINGQVKGEFPMTHQVRRLLEKELEIDLEPFLRKTVDKMEDL